MPDFFHTGEQLRALADSGHADVVLPQPLLDATKKFLEPCAYKSAYWQEASSVLKTREQAMSIRRCTTRASPRAASVRPFKIRMVFNHRVRLSGFTGSLIQLLSLRHSTVGLST